MMFNFLKRNLKEGGTIYSNNIPDPDAYQQFMNDYEEYKQLSNYTNFKIPN